MTMRPWQRVLHHLRAVTGSESIHDAQLLERFVQQRDEAAFELLVRRHERLVLGACRRILRNPHDVDDAFQATFLTLVRKAGTIGQWESVGSWLYKVAYRIALRANETVKRHSRREQTGLAPLDVAGPGDPTDDLLRRELRPLLDQEINRLPVKYRAPVILCYLEGKNYDEAALELGCPKGTLSTRLTRARELLRERLIRRGLALSTATLGTLLAAETASAATPALVAVTVRAAGSLLTGSAAGDVSTQALTWMEGVLNAMFYVRMKVVSVFALALVLLGTGVGLWTKGALAVDVTGTEKPAPTAQGPQIKPEKIPPAPAFDRAEITLFLLGQNPPGEKRKTLTDRAQVRKLAAFFPDVGMGREAPVAGGYIAVARVKFERKGGPPVTVQIAPAYEYWSEGKGDWKAKPGLKDYLDQLFQPQHAGELGWSKALNDLRGRLLLRSWQKDNGTDVLMLYVELENVGRSPLQIDNRPSQVKITVRDARGQLVKESGLPGSGPGVPLQTAVIPGGAYLGLNLHCSSVGIPKDYQGALLPLHNGDWLLKPGRYTLHATFTHNVPDGNLNVPINVDSPRRWAGVLDIPTLEIEILPPRKQGNQPAF